MLGSFNHSRQKAGQRISTNKKTGENQKEKNRKNDGESRGVFQTTDPIP